MGLVRKWGHARFPLIGSSAAARLPIRSVCVTRHWAARRPPEFEMADGWLAAGGLGPEAMGPEAERTGWAAEEEPAPVERGEYPPRWPRGACEARGSAAFRPRLARAAAAARARAPVRTWAAAARARASPLLPAQPGRGGLGTGGSWTGLGMPSLPGCLDGLPGRGAPLAAAP